MTTFRKLLPILIGTSLSLGLVGSAGAMVRYVDCDAPPGGDGLSWATAYNVLTDGLAAAVAGDQVWVAAGTYVGNFTLGAEVALYGGFAGTETALSQRNWRVNRTILDGNQTGSVIAVAQGATNLARVDGFTITNGTGTLVGIRRCGGGLYLNGAAPTIANNTIVRNSAYHGGALYLSSSTALVMNNTIVMNSGASSGGGLSLDGSSATVANNVIVGNRAGRAGGGLYLYTSPGTVVNNTICSNTANGMADEPPQYFGGGIAMCDCNPTIANNISALNSSGIASTTRLDSPVLRRNCVSDGHWGYVFNTSDDIMVDPQLADPRYGNWHIQADSPCVDAGNSTYVVGTRDMDGQPRTWGTVDIGADESDGTIWPLGPYAIVRVSPTGDDNNNGSSWNAAKRTVQAALDAAMNVGGDVWVAAGTYGECLTLLPYVRLLGGFAGSETDEAQRDWDANVTILDGQQLGTVVTVLAIGDVSTVDGFTIRNGNGSYGGVCLSTGSPSVLHCKITDNTGTYGGGLYVACPSALIRNNAIVRNAGTGSGTGGVAVRMSLASIGNCLIAGNTYGGVSVMSDGSNVSACNPTITSCTIAGNSGYGLLVGNYGTAKLYNSIVAFNTYGVNAHPYDGWVNPRNNCVYGNSVYNFLPQMTDPTGTYGNISADPWFVRTPDAGPDGVWATADDDAGDVHLRFGSACIDAGNNTYAAGDLDLDGLPRLVDGDENGTVLVDMGPYEFQGLPPVCSGDANCDGVIDWHDIDFFVAAMNDNTAAWQAMFAPGAPACLFANNDVDSDGTVNWRDIDPLVAVMNTTCP